MWGACCIEGRLEADAGRYGLRDGPSATEVMSSSIEDTVRALAGAISELQRAQAHLDREVADAQAAVSRAERRLQRALGGMSPARWRALVSGRASIRTATDSRDAHLAKKQRREVEAAMAEASEAHGSREVLVARAEHALEQAAHELGRFGPLATRLTAGAQHRSATRLRDAPSSIRT